MGNQIFHSEKELVTQFTSKLLSATDPWATTAHILEFDYKRGRADVVGFSASGQVVAFEAKLERWRHALHQAYRNTCFAHLSYVVLPRPAALSAWRYAPEFQRRGVGLCAVGVSALEILLEARAAQPIQLSLSRRAARAVREGGIH